MGCRGMFVLLMVSGYDLSKVGKNSRAVIFNVIFLESEVKGYVT